MDKLSNWTQEDFKSFFSGRFVTREEMNAFATKDELRQVAKEASDHSTSIIKSAVTEAVTGAVKDTVRDTLVSVGIDPSKPIEMQATMASLINIAKTKETDKNTFRGTIIKLSTNAITMFAAAGFVVYLAKIFKVIK
jgi:hypothetical protein